MRVTLDATDMVVGRIASYAAKQALLGNEVVIVNAEKALLRGAAPMILGEYLSLRRKGGTAQKGPNFPSRPEFILKRTIRGMIPYKQGRGKEAFKRIRCYVGNPESLPTEKILRKKTDGRFMTLEHLSHLLKK